MEADNRKAFSTGLWNSSGEHSCPQCGRILSANVPSGELCSACRELNLFADVREYIRENDVNEFEVAIHFNIPRSKVKGWIEDGRIEYKEEGGTRFLGQGQCELCGAPIAFGSLCTNCKRKLDDKKKQGYAIIKPVDEEDDRMRFRHLKDEE